MNDPETRLQIPIWISQDESMPDTCCRCGMFTDLRIKIRHVFYITEDAGGSIWLVLAGFLFSPLGLLMMFLDSPDKEAETKTIKKKVKFRVPVCVLCQGGSRLNVQRYHPANREFEVIVHPEFASRYQNLVNQE